MNGFARICLTQHLHALLTGGGWDVAGQWRKVYGWDRPVLRELFEAEVFRFLRERILLRAERMKLIRPLKPIRRWWTGFFGMWAGVPGNRPPSF